MVAKLNKIDEMTKLLLKKFKISVFLTILKPLLTILQVRNNDFMVLVTEKFPEM